MQNAPEHSAILLTFIKLPFVIKIFILSILSGCLRQVLLYVLCQEMKTQIKCCKIQRFNQCQDKNNFQRKKYNIIWKL